MSTIKNISKDSESLILSFIPEIIRREYSKKNDLSIGKAHVGKYAALLWIDICDFSSLSNEILERGSDGLEKLSKTLFDHYDPLLNLVHKWGGEPVLFAGDGVLVAWYSDDNELEDEIRLAITVGQKVIEQISVKSVDGKVIKLHVVAACGSFHLLEVLDYEGRILISPLGNALTDLRIATASRAPNEVLLSRNVLDIINGKIKTANINDKAKIVDEVLSPNSIALKKNDLGSVDVKNFLPYVPVSIQYQLDRDRIKWIAELRLLTILYVRLAGFDPDSENSVESLQKAVKIASEVVYRNEGILGQVWIDEKDANLLIYFGPPPTAHRDNPERGVKTAITLDRAVSQAGFNVSIGVVSGSNFCGLLGNDIFRQYTVLGDIVTLGARLAHKKNGGVWCDNATYNLTKKSVDYNEHTTIEIKGAKEAVQVWEPHFDEGALRQESGILTVGRSFEQQLLTNEWERISQGGTGAFVLEGESGMGKSKLLEDFVNSCIKNGAHILRGKPERVENKTPYQAVRNVFSAILGVENVSDPKIKMEKISENLGPEFIDQASLLNVVLQIDFPESEQLSLLSGMQKSGETRALLIKLLRRYAEKHAFILVIDEAQWMDSSSWSLSAEMCRNIKGCFLICSLQNTNLVPASQELLDAGATKYQLRALSADFEEQLIASVLKVDKVSDDICEAIKKISKGNPFFCIELAQALLDERSIVCKDDYYEFVKDGSKIRLPQTIKGAVRRKLDLLDPGPEMALKVASVTGHRFSMDLVQNVYPIKSERQQVPEYIDKDCKLGLLNFDVVDHIEEYTFNHSVTREVAYEALLREQREPLHRETAVWYEETFADNLTPYLARIAYHLERAGEVDKAVDYLEKEAIRLFSLGYPKEAVDIGLHAARLLNVNLDTDPQKIGPKIGENMGAIGALMAGRHPAELLEHKSLNNKETERLLLLLLGIGPFAFQSRQIELFALISITCLRITLEQGNGAPAPDVYSMYSAIHRGLTGNRIEANAWSQLALDMDNKLGGTLHSRVAFVHTWFHNHWRQALSSSLEISEKAGERGFASGDFLFACFNISGHVVYQAACGNKLEDVINTAKKYLVLNPRKVMNAAFHLIHEMQIAKAFAGLTESPLSLTDDEYDEGKDIASICETEFGNQIGYYLVSRIRLHQHYGDWKGALDFAEKVQPLLPAFEGQIAEVDYLQFKTFAEIDACFADSTLDIREQINSSIDVFKNWAGLCSSNFAHKAMMLEGMYLGLSGNYEEGMRHLDNAALKAEDAGYLNDLALIYECQLKLQFQEGKKLDALEKAFQAYELWGAKAKVEYLRKRYIN